MNAINGIFYWFLRVIGMEPTLGNENPDYSNDNPREELLQTVDEMNRTIRTVNPDTASEEGTLLFRFRTYVNACVMTVVHSADHEIVTDAMDRLNTMRARLNEKYVVITGLIPSVDDCVNKIISLSQSVVRSKESTAETELQDKIEN